MELFHFSNTLTLRNIMITMCISGLMSKNSTFYALNVHVFIYSVGSYNKYPVFICKTLADWDFKSEHILFAIRYELNAF
jgi:hypothetical protein